VTLARRYSACLVAGLLAVAGPLALGASEPPSAATPTARAAHHPLSVREAKRQIVAHIQAEWSIPASAVTLRCRARGRYKVRCETAFSVTGKKFFCGLAHARAYGPQRHQVMTQVRVRPCR
jgi:hypothetical protein